MSNWRCLYDNSANIQHSEVYGRFSMRDAKSCLSGGSALTMRIMVIKMQKAILSKTFFSGQI